MIVIPLRETRPTSWTAFLRNSITELYGSPEPFAKEIEIFSELRESAVGASANLTGRDLLYRYYAQLELLGMRLSFRQLDGSISFTWYNLYDGEEITQKSVVFEKASILFNLAAVFSQIGNDAVSTQDWKAAYSAYQSAAGIWKQISTQFLYAPSHDLAPVTATALSNLMLALAQASFTERAKETGAKPGLLAKLSKGTLQLLNTSLEALNELQDENDWGDDKWISEIEGMVSEWEAFEHESQSLHHESTGEVGKALNHLAAARDLTKKIDKPKYEDLSVRFKNLERENDLIYHETVPSKTEEVPSTVVAKATPMDNLIPAKEAAQIVGPELFSRVIPLDVHEKASLYSEQKARLVREQQEKCDIANQELSSALEYMDLPQAASVLRRAYDSEEKDVPDAVLEWATAVSGLSFIDFSSQRKRILGMCAGGDPFAVQQVKQTLVTAASTDKYLMSQWQQLEPRVKVLLDPSALQAAFQNANSNSQEVDGSPQVDLLDINEDNQDFDSELDSVTSATAKLRKVEKERNSAFADLKTQVRDDDIGSKLVSRRNEAEKLFKEEIQKFQPLIRRIEATIRLQTNLLNEISSRWKRLLVSQEGKKRTKTRDLRLQKRTALIEKLHKTYQDSVNFKEELESQKSLYKQLEVQAARPSQSKVPPVPPKPPLPPKGDQSGYTVPSAYNSSFYR